MKNLLFIIFLFCTMQACKSGVPKELIQQDKMINILYDIHILDGYLNSIPDPDSAKKIAAAYYKGIYKKFKIDSALYSESMDYYYKHPDLMASMYETITMLLTREQERLDKANRITLTAEDRKIDSVKVRDSLNKLLFIDTARIDTAKRDSVKKKLDLIQPKIIYKELKFKN